MWYENREFEVNNSGTPTSFTLDTAPEPSTVAILAVSENKLIQMPEKKHGLPPFDIFRINKIENKYEA
jgi:hypothetical protein